MRRQIIRHVVGILGTIPLLGAIMVLLADGGVDNFNPWADAYFEMWIVGLPLVIGGAICLVNSVVGLAATWSGRPAQ